MKKSEMTVSMPLSAWEEYERLKREFLELRGSLADCFDDSLIKAGCSVSVDFDVRKAVEVCKKYMPYSQQKFTIEIKV